MPVRCKTTHEQKASAADRSCFAVKLTLRTVARFDARNTVLSCSIVRGKSHQRLTAGGQLVRRRSRGVAIRRARRKTSSAMRSIWGTDVGPTTPLRAKRLRPCGAHGEGSPPFVLSGSQPRRPASFDVSRTFQSTNNPAGLCSLFPQFPQNRTIATDLVLCSVLCS